MSVKENIENKLTAAFSPLFIEVEDQSHKHAGHVGARPEGETHFHVILISADFSAKSRVACQRMVYKVLAEELVGPVHALSLDLKDEISPSA